MTCSEHPPERIECLANITRQLPSGSKRTVQSWDSLHFTTSYSLSQRECFLVRACQRYYMTLIRSLSQKAPELQREMITKLRSIISCYPSSPSSTWTCRFSHFFLFVLGHVHTTLACARHLHNGNTKPVAESAFIGRNTGPLKSSLY